MILLVALYVSMSLGKDCAEEYDACLSTSCCKNATNACMKRPNKMYAQCRPLNNGASGCVDEPGKNGWLCPATWQKLSPPSPPLPCDVTFDSCTDSKCCKYKSDACVQRSGVKYWIVYANVRRCKHYDDGLCKDGDGWLCPATWAVPSAPPPPHPPAHPLSQLGRAQAYEATNGHTHLRSHENSAVAADGSSGASSTQLYVVYGVGAVIAAGLLVLIMIKAARKFRGPAESTSHSTTMLKKTRADEEAKASLAGEDDDDRDGGLSARDP
eukprot:6212293-Pleurochrysis_carterae.AAC.4